MSDSGSITLIASIILSVFIGWNILYLLLQDKGSLAFQERLAISYGLGVGALSLEMLIISLAGLKFRQSLIIIPWVALFIANAAVYFMKRPERQQKPSYADPVGKKKAHRNLAAFLSGAVILEIFYAFFKALIKPMESYDAVAIYAIKSKIFYLARSIPSEYFSVLAGIFPHSDYPLNIPLFQTFLYMAMGNFNDQLVKLVFPLYFVAVLVMLYFAVKRIGGSLYALLFTFVLATIAQFNAYAANGYIDLPLSFYCFTSLLLLLEYFGDTKKAYCAVLSAIMTGLAAWTKNEGMLYCVINISLFLIFLAMNRKKIALREIGGLFVYAGIIFIIYSPWLWAKAVYGLSNADVGSMDIASVNMAKQSYKTLPILYEFQRQFFGPKKWNLIWIVAMLAIYFNPKKLFSKNLQYLTFYIFMAFCGYMFIYLVSDVEILFFLKTTWSRFPIHFMPALVYWLALMLKEDIKL